MIITSKKWLKDLNYKKSLILSLRELQRQIPTDIFKKALEIHEAKDGFFNVLKIKNLEALIVDLEKAKKTSGVLGS